MVLLTRRQSAKVRSFLSHGTGLHLWTPPLQQTYKNLHPHQVLERALLALLQNPLCHLRNTAWWKGMKALRSLSPQPKEQIAKKHQQQWRQQLKQPSTKPNGRHPLGGYLPGQKALLHDCSESFR